jgi:cytochrome c553
MRLSTLAFLVVLATGCQKKESAEARRAQQIWRERCTECHGASGRGDGPGAAKLDARPKDFSDREWQDREEDDELADVIVSGGRAHGYSAEMPPNPDLAGEPEVVQELVRIIRSFRR